MERIAARRAGGRLGDALEVGSRAAALRLLKLVRGGRITLVEGASHVVFGGGDALACTVTVVRPRFYTALLRGSMAVARSYAAGDFDCDDLVSLTRIAARSAGPVDRLRTRLRPVAEPVKRGAGLLRRNTRRRSRDRIAHHYDIGNDFFSVMLDDTMAYSCGTFDGTWASLRQASAAKFERACLRLELSPGDRVLEIGTGWGGFALHAASRFGCHVTTATISAEQHRHAVARVRDAGRCCS